MFAVKETFKQTIKHPLIYRQISQENLQRVNKTCIITGASRGIGALLAKRLSENNYNVVIAAKSEKENLKLPELFTQLLKK